MTLRRRMLVFTLIVLPVLLVTLYSFILTRQQLIAQIYQERRTMASLASGILYEKLSHLDDVGLSLATGPAFCDRVNNNEWDSAIKLMKKIPSDFSFIKAVFVADTFGMIKVHTPAPSVTGEQSILLAKWSKELEGKGQSYLSEVYKRTGDNDTTYCAFAISILNSKYIKCGILVLEVNVHELLNWSNGVSFGESGFVYIVDQSGHIAANPDYMHSDTVVDYSSVPAVQKALQGLKDVEILYNPIANENRLSAYQQVPVYKWAVIVQQEAIVAVAVFTKLRFVFFFYIIVLLAAMGLAWAIIAVIAKRERTEKQLRKYIDLVENAQVLSRDLDNRIISWNKGMQNLYYWNSQEALGQVSHQLLHAIFPCPLPEIEAEFYKNGEWKGEIIHTRKDGSIVNVSSHWYLHRDTEGIPIAILETNNDITAFKQAEEKVRKSEEISRLLMENVKDYAIFMLDPKGKILSWNKGAESIKGYRAADVLGKSLEIFYTDYDLQKGTPLKNLKMARSSGTYEDVGWRVKKDGSRFWADVVFTALFDASGELRGYAKVTRDITERKIAEERVHFLVGQINQSNDAIYVVDKELKIKSWNKGAERIYGFSAKEAIGMTSNELLQTDITTEYIDEVLKYLDQKGYWAGELKRKTKSGNDIYVRSSTTVIKDNEGMITGHVSVSIDITEQLKLREKIEYLAAIVDQSTDAIISVNLKGELISSNHAAEKLAGYDTEKSIVDITETSAILGIGEDEMANILISANKNGTWISEKMFNQKTGRSFYGSITASPIRNQSGDSNSVVFMVKDISLRKQLEEKLKRYNDELEKKIQDRTTTLIKSEKRFRALLENNFDIISLMDRSFKIIYRSPSAERFTGWKNEETIGESGETNIHPDDQEYTRKIISEVLENPGKPIATLFRNRHKKGHYIWVEGIATNLLDDENVNAILFNFRDVSDRKLALEKIQESEANLHSIFENTSEAYILLDRNFKIKSFNTNAQVLTGYSSLLKLEAGKSIINFAEPSREEFMKESLYNVLEGKSIQFDRLFTLKTSKLKWFNISINPVIENARITGICITCRDITARKETEEKLENNEKRFRAMVENNEGIIALLDENFANIYRGPASERITGWSPEERMHVGTTEQTHPDDVQAVQEISKAVLANPGKPYKISLRTKHKNGHYIWLDGVITNMIKDPNIGAIITNFRDVTKEKEAEFKLMKSEQMYRSLFENLLHAFAYLKVIFENGVFKDVQYLAVNNEYELLLGVKDIAGKKISEVLPGLLETDASYVELITNVVLTGKPVKFETFVKPLNMWLAVSLYSPERGYFVSLLDNISEQKEAEHKIKKINIELEERVSRRTNELKRANEELESFSYSVSHDLRAPLRAIIGFTAILEDEYSSQLDDEAKRLTGIIKSNTQKMGNLIDDLLSFSRVRRQNIDKIAVENNILLKEIISNIEKADGAAEIKWIIHTLHTVRADINALRQVWINLISNAVKYSGNRKLPIIEINSYATDNEVVFSIKDNGVGFDQKYSAKLFKVFQRLHSSDEFEGTGVGLALVERIISKHGGNVWVEAELDKGACFYFSLPIN